MATKETEPKNIKLIDEKGAEFTVFLSHLTSGRVDKIQSLLGGTKTEQGYSDLEKQIENIVLTYETLPETFKTEIGFDAVRPLFTQLENGKLTQAQLIDKLRTVLSSQITMQAKARNTVILREIVRAMCLISQLTPEQQTLIQSDVQSDFWCDQDAVLIRDTGEFFRRKVLEYSR
jgi:hypothetical protein